MVAVDATLQVEQPDTTLDPLKVAADAQSPTTVALPVLDAAARALLALILEQVSATGEVSLSPASLAALEQITATVSNFPPTQMDALTNAELRAAPVAVSFPADEAGLTNAELRASSVEVADAAEQVGLIAVPFTISAVGTTTLVAAPGGATRLRLRRISPTYAIRSPDSEPILQLKVGDVEAQRGNALTGRFDITAATSADAITLTVDVLDTPGRVSGTIYYETV